MNNIFIITCYQFDVTRDLINLLGPDKCYLVLDCRSEDYLSFKYAYEDRIISEGPFKYYSLEEAIGRLDMFKNLMKVTNGDFDYVHIISQNDLPIRNFYRIESVLEDRNYICKTQAGWVSNYMSLKPNGVRFLNSKYDECKSRITDMYNSGWFTNTKGHYGAPSELLWDNILDEVPDWCNFDYRFYTYPGNHVNGVPGGYIGKSERPTSPVTFYNGTSARNAILSSESIFARKFKYKSKIYNWAYNLALNKYNIK